MGATPSASQTLATSAAGNGNVPFITGRHCSRPSVLTCSSVLMSMSRSRTFTLASVRGESRYTSSLSCARPGASALNRPSASPKLAPKVRHSQRGMIASIEWLRARVTLALRVVNSADRGRIARSSAQALLALRCRDTVASVTCYVRARWPPGRARLWPLRASVVETKQGRESTGVEGRDANRDQAAPRASRPGSGRQRAPRLRLRRPAQYRGLWSPEIWNRDRGDPWLPLGFNHRIPRDLRNAFATGAGRGAGPFPCHAP